jgi:DNA mismatch endonuclease Vsr
MLVRRMLHALGYRYRLHRRNLPSTPDIVFVSQKKLIFVHGCFNVPRHAAPRNRQREEGSRMGRGATEGCHERRATLPHERGRMPVGGRTMRTALSLTLAIAASWLSPAREQEAMDGLLAIWSEASTVALADTSRRRFQYPRDLRRPSSPARYRQASLPTLCKRLAGELFAAARSPGAASAKIES